MSCISLPKVTVPSIELMGGAEISGFLDFSQGAPTDCKTTFSLLLQLAPVLASMACLLKILNVIAKLEAFVQAASPPFLKLPGTIPDLLSAIADLKGCIPPLAFPQFIFMITGMLKLIINFLDCFLTQLSSIISFQASIDLSSAEGNPVLMDALVCAQNNASASMDNLMTSLQPLDPILETITAVAGIAQLPITLPKISDISASADSTSLVTSLQKAIDSIKSVIDGLPS